MAAMLMLAATGCYAALTLIARHVSTEVHPVEVLFFRNLIGVAIMLPWIWRMVRPTGLSAARIGMHGTRAAFNSLSLACWFGAVGLMPLAEATAITFTAPLWVMVFAALFLTEPVRARRLGATLIGFIGVLIILRPGSAGASVDPLGPGPLLALGAAAAWALTVVSLRSLARTEKPEAIMAWQVLLMAPISLPPALFYWSWPSGATLLWLCLLAVLATVGQLCHIRALKLQDVTALQPIDFIKLPVVAILALMLFGEEPSLAALIGGVVVFAAATFVSWREAQAKRPSRPVGRPAVEP